MKNLNSVTDLLIQLIKTNFKMRYQNSVLGILWVIIKPYSTFFILYMVWTRLRGDGIIENYNIYLLIGILFYTYFNELIIFGMNSILDLKGVVLKINFPRIIALVSSLSNAVINLMINFGFIIILIFFNNIDINFMSFFYFFLVAIIAFIWAVGIASFTSIFLVRFRDLKNIAELALFLIYWMTPIFYVLDNFQVAGRFTDLLYLNPFGILINQVRAAFGIYGEINPLLLILFLLSGILFTFFGWLYFRRKVKKVAEFI